MTSKERAAGVGAPAAGEADETSSHFDSKYTTKTIVSQPTAQEAYRQLHNAWIGLDFEIEPILELYPALPLDSALSAEENRATVARLLESRSEIRDFVQEQGGEDPEPASETAPISANSIIQDVSLQEVQEALPRGEAGDADLLAHLYRDHLRFDDNEHEWYGNFGHYYQEYDPSRLVSHKLQSVYIQAASDAIQVANDQQLRDAFLSRARKLCYERRIKPVLRQASRHPDLVIKSPKTTTELPGERRWDPNPNLLGCANGVIDLARGIFRPGRPGDHIRTFAPTPWKGIDAEAPRWETFLQEVFAANWTLISFVQRLLGYGITGHSIEHVLPVFHGIGRNGKDTLLGAVMHTLGDLAKPVDSSVILRSRIDSRSATPYLYAMRFCRLGFISESQEGAQLNAELVKRLTGGSPISARPLYGDPATFKPRYLLILSTNHKPRAASDDFALWKRLILIHFDQIFVDDPQADNEHPRDPYLLEKLKEEAPGILAWLVRGCLEWQRDKLNPPDEVLEATADYHDDEDVIGIFIDQACVLDDEASTQAQELYNAYREWSKDQGLKPMSGLSFGKRVNRRFRRYKDSSGCRRYVGVGLLSRETPPEGEEEQLELQP